MEQIITTINNIVWSNWLVGLFLIAGIYFSCRTRFLQVRQIKEMSGLAINRKKSEKGISSFQALSVSLAGRIGTGNIAGVGTAIALGGPGAIFWMWIIAFLGAGTAFVESTLGQLYKVEEDGQYRGGPAYYIEKGLGKKGFGILFAMATLIAMGLLLPGVQANSIANSMNTAFGLESKFVGILLIVVLGGIIFGGIRRIGVVAELIVPFMGLAYIIMALLIILFNIDKLPGVIALIFRSAFGAEQAFAGIIGLTVSWGVKRGVYSNEAGRGTGPQSAAAAEANHPAEQGFLQTFSVYIDTLVVCSATAFMILICQTYNVVGPDGAMIVEYLPGIEYGPSFTQLAIDSFVPGFGKSFVAVALFFFAFTSAMASYYIAETNLSYLSKKLFNKEVGKLPLNILRVVLLSTVYLGCIRKAGLAWTLGDIGVGITAWINIIAIFFMTKPALACLQDYEAQRKAGIAREDLTFDPIKLGITGADFWEDRLNKSKSEEVS